MSGAITLLTGPSGSGKTTLCRELAAKAAGAGHQVAGIVSPARFEGRHKLGIDALDLRSGEVRPLARRPAAGVDDRPPPWSFQEATLAWGDEILRNAVPCALLVVDELGPLEWRDGRGWPSGLAAVDSRAFEHALVVVRPSLIALATARWPLATVVHAAEERAHAHLRSLFGRESSAPDSPR